MKVLINSKRIISALLTSLIILSTCLTGCGGGDSEDEDIPDTPVVTPVKTAAVQSSNKSTTTTKVTKVTAPKLYDVSFTLTMDESQEYAENTLPIFLAKTHIIHMNWLVQKGGQHFHMTFTLPSGKLISMNENGTFSNYNQGDDSEDLFNGDMVFCPGNNNWADGYYLFHPQIRGADKDVTVKLIYWIETPGETK